jgi:hypothetical protein
MPPIFEIVRDPTGVPEPMYDSTTTRNTSRARSVSSVTGAFMDYP